MDANEYQTLALRTELNVSVEEFRNRIDGRVLRMLHASMGFCTEAGELMDVLKRYLYYGQPLDEDKLSNAIEELGDICWYVAIGASSVGVDMSKVLEKNIAKLKIRFPNQFTSELALNRDLGAEAIALEG